MKIIVTILTLFAIVCNAAVANMGSIRFCIEKGDETTISFDCVEEPRDPCCFYEDLEQADQLDHLANCDSCLDGEIDVEDFDGTLSSSERFIVKDTPLAFYSNPIDIASLRSQIDHRKCFPARSPPIEQ